MTPGILKWLERTRQKVNARGRILEVGAFDVNGCPRPLFPNAAEYIGVDQAAGPNVDLVVKAADLAAVFPAESFDVVVCCEMLEHDPTPWLTLAAIRAVLKPGGWLLATSPGNGFPEHRFPRDYWRIMPDAWREIVFAGYELRELHATADGVICGAGLRRRGA